ncbi:hypothetical protein G7054_g4256 [Neopestalotiopsis clavispora]|nr:hypothetical protein G7054_g4256 [Neopestalotiopsis clavispora]
MHRCSLRRTIWQATSSLNATSRVRDGVSYQFRRAISSVPHTKNKDVDAFRNAAFVPELPLLIRGSHKLTPTTKWFTDEQGSSASLSTHLTRFNDVLFPYELIRHLHPDQQDPTKSFADWLRPRQPDLALHLSNVLDQLGDSEFKSSTSQTTFYQFHAPLGLLEQATVYNALVDDEHRVKRLYIAQSQLNELPPALNDDLPAPAMVRQAGKGDIYDSSIWLGLEPTYTPLHRDPNPNLFVQLLSAKTIRLLKPSLGQQLYARIQHQLGSQGNSRFRGSEMMQGPERAALYNAIWGIDPSENILEAALEPEDALFIPKGWWHSVQSRFSDGRLNASVNWWFR